jgi:hypothetical protein
MEVVVKSIDLKAKLQNCKTGTTVFCRSDEGVEGATIRKVLKSYWNHTAVVFWINGELFIVEANLNDVIRPKRFDLWHKDREFNEFGVSECSVHDNMITKHFGSKPVRYDLASVLLYMGIYQKTGKWLGRKEEHAADRMFCFEFSALVRELPNWWRFVPKDFPV